MPKINTVEEINLDSILLDGKHEIKELKTKNFYKYLVGQRKMKPLLIQRWEEEYPMVKLSFTKNEWEWIYKVSRITLNTQMQSLHYKIISRIINCGYKLNE